MQLEKLIREFPTPHCCPLTCRSNSGVLLRSGFVLECHCAGSGSGMSNVSSAYWKIPNAEERRRVMKAAKLMAKYAP